MNRRKFFQGSAALTALVAAELAPWQSINAFARELDEFVRGPAVKDHPLRQVSKHVWMIFSPDGFPTPENQGMMCNITFVDTAKGIVVVDSGSADKTVTICKDFGCKVLQREFDGYGTQKQYAVDQASNDWVFSIDADEVASEELRQELVKSSSANSQISRYTEVLETDNTMGNFKTPSQLSPPLPFDSIILIFVFIFPLYFTSQFFMMSIMNERIERKGEILLSTPVKAGSIGTLVMRIGGLFSKEAKETVECMYQWTAPFVVDSSKFTAAFGPLAVTPHAEAIAATIAASR